MNMNLQPQLQDERVRLRPLHENEFNVLYEIASDPKIWEQHPQKDRWKKDVFQTFFDGAIQSGGAFMIINKETDEAIGSTRFYEYNKQENSIFIGYTFYAVAYWGTGINPAVKKLMLDYAFSFVSKVYFHIGATNIRSQIAIARLGAVKVDEQEVSYFGEPSKLNFIYEITREFWQKRKASV